MDSNRIIEVLKDFLNKLGVAFDSVDTTEIAGSTFFTIHTGESGKLIGNQGETLSALNHIVKKTLEKEIPEDAHFVIDVNGYNARRVKSLEDQARLVADRARTFHYDIEMSPMSAYERMIVHSTLKEMPDIETVSHGEGKMRHIVVRYKDPNAPSTQEV